MGEDECEGNKDKADEEDASLEDEQATEGFLRRVSEDEYAHAEEDEAYCEDAEHVVGQDECGMNEDEAGRVKHECYTLYHT